VDNANFRLKTKTDSLKRVTVFLTRAHLWILRQFSGSQLLTSSLLSDLSHSPRAHSKAGTARRYRLDVGCLTDLVRCIVIAGSLENVEVFLQLLYSMSVVELNDTFEETEEGL
jgi:hypothetical protein